MRQRVGGAAGRKRNDQAYRLDGVRIGGNGVHRVHRGGTCGGDKHCNGSTHRTFL
jgi:hypothetical protein